MNLAVSIFDFPATIWRDGLINLACIVFAFWYFRAKRFTFLRIGKIGEWAFQSFILAILFLFFNKLFCIRLEAFGNMQNESLDDQATTVSIGALLAFAIFSAMWLKNKLMSSRR